MIKSNDIGHLTCKNKRILITLQIKHKKKTFCNDFANTLQAFIQ